MHINISPNNKPLTHKIIIYPVVPGELWLADLRTLDITSTVSNEVLEETDDDQGLYYRLKSGSSVEFRSYIHKFGITHILFACAPKQIEAPFCSNKFIIYDMYAGTRIVDPHICSRGCQYSDVFERPDFKILHMDKLYKLYDDEDDLVFWGGSKFPRPLLVRDFKSDLPNYKLIDPYLQWSPPKFWHEEDFVASIPDNLEIWISNIIDSFNWDYFYSLLHDDGHPRANIDNLAASIFDIVYEEYLYYGICKKLWMTPKPEKDEHPQLLGKIEQQVLVNFTDIVNSIHETILARLLKEELLPIEREEVDEPIDREALTSAFSNMFKSLEDPDE